MYKAKTVNAYVRVSSQGRPEDNIQKALRKLDDQLKAENFKQELDKRRFFIPPGERKRIKSKAARARARHDARRAAMRNPEE